MWYTRDICGKKESFKKQKKNKFISMRNNRCDEWAVYLHEFESLTKVI